jgi:hypothetical protein
MGELFLIPKISKVIVTFLLFDAVDDSSGIVGYFKHIG